MWKKELSTFIHTIKKRGTDRGKSSYPRKVINSGKKVEKICRNEAKFSTKKAHRFPLSKWISFLKIFL